VIAANLLRLPGVEIDVHQTAEGVRAVPLVKAAGLAQSKAAILVRGNQRMQYPGQLSLQIGELLTSATEGAVIARLYGRMRMGGNII
jgi:hypothetical protein